MDWFPLYLFLGAFGVMAMLPFLSFHEIGSYFFRLHALIALVTVMIATFLQGGSLETSGEICLLVFAGTVVLEYGLLQIKREKFPRLLLLIPGLAGLMAVAIVGGAIEKPVFVFHLLTSGWMTGSVLVAMNLGHFYLTKGDLSFDHLIRSTRILLGLILVKIVMAGTFLISNFEKIDPILMEFDGMMMAVRILVGLLSVLGLGWMAHSCAKSKSNQSATGILYVVVIFVIIGELTSMYLTFEKGMLI